MPTIVSSSRSRGGALIGSLLTRSSAVDEDLITDSLATATVSFSRIVHTEELVKPLQEAHLMLASVRYREVGPYSGDFTFSEGTDAAAALAAADAYLRYSKLAEVFAAQQGVTWVYVPGVGPMNSARPMRFGDSQEELTPETALRPTRDQLDTIPLQNCVADERLEQPFTNEGPDAAMLEAACGLRLYAIVVRGERTSIESFAAALDFVESVRFSATSN